MSHFRVIADSIASYAVFIKYFLLSAYLVYFGHLLFPSVDTVPVKIMVDCLLFFSSYYIQKNYIFKR